MDLHDLVLQGPWRKELIDYLVLLDGQGMQIDVLDRIYLVVLHQAAELRHGNPLLLLPLAFALALALLALALALETLARVLALAEAALAHGRYGGMPNLCA